jgi:hypothetical protein
MLGRSLSSAARKVSLRLSDQMASGQRISLGSDRGASLAPPDDNDPWMANDVNSAGMNVAAALTVPAAVP